MHAMKFRNCYQLSLAIAALCASGMMTARAANASSISYDITDLGKLPGGSYSSAYGINDNGQVVYSAEVPNASPVGSGSYAFLYDGGALLDLGTLHINYFS